MSRLHRYVEREQVGMIFIKLFLLFILIGYSIHSSGFYLPGNLVNALFVGTALLGENLIVVYWLWLNEDEKVHQYPSSLPFSKYCNEKIIVQ